MLIVEEATRRHTYEKHIGTHPVVYPIISQLFRANRVPKK